MLLTFNYSKLFHLSKMRELHFTSIDIYLQKFQHNTHFQALFLASSKTTFRVGFISINLQ